MTKITVDPKFFSEMQPHGTTLVGILRFRACRQPDQRVYTFLVDGETKEVSLTYGELDRQARAIATSLQSLGITKSECVLLLYPPGLEYIAAFFGCLYAGVVAVPAYPPQRKRKRNTSRLMAIVADSQARIVLTMKSTLQRFFGYAPELKELLCLTTDSLVDNMEDNWKEPMITSDTLAFFQYTSGSTGTPKGVMLTHGNLIYNQRMIKYSLEHTEKSVSVSWLPLYHDMGLIGTVLQSLYVGFPCILMSPNHFMQRPLRWLAAISRYKASTSGGPNFAYDFCVQKISPEQREMLDLSSWSVAFSGAEFVRSQTLERFARAFEPCGFHKETFFPCYGLAEATLIVSGGGKNVQPVVKRFEKTALEQNCAIETEADSEGILTLVGCGQTILDQEIAIVQPESLTRCTDGQIGEIWVAGQSVAQGYWRQPAETERTFKAHIANSEDGPFLRTGDLGFCQNGQLFITGRIKDLIIIRGRNYFPQDIELTVERVHPTLQSNGAAAFSVEVDNEEQLVVVQEVAIRPKSRLAGAIDAIRKAIAEEHGVQVYAVILIKQRSLPRTSSGKIQRYACRYDFLNNNLAVIDKWCMDDKGCIANISEYVAPQTEIQQVLTEIWAEVLGIEQVGIHDNFFNLGGDSLRATEVVARLLGIFHIDIDLLSLFETPTIAELAELVQRLLSGSGRSQTTSLLPVARNESLHLSSAQERLWFLNRLTPTSAYYNIPAAIHLTGLLNVTALEQSFSEIIRRHEVLHTNFSTIAGQPFQVITGQLSLTLPVIDIQELSEGKCELETKQLAAEEGQQLFDLELGLLLRIKLLCLSKEEHVLLLTVHHIVFDGWSMRNLTKELSTLYEAFSIGNPSPLSELSIQYVDFSHWQRQWEQGEISKKHLAYWSKQLAGAVPVLELAIGNPRPAVQTFRGAKQFLELPATLIQALKKFSHQEEKTLFMILLAAFQALLKRYTSENEIVVGSPVANRNRVELEGLIGFFVNTVVLRTDLSGDPSFRELLSRVRRVALGAYAHQDLPFAKLVQHLRPERNLSYSPLFQVMFDVRDIPAFELPGLAMNLIDVDSGAAQFDLSMFIDIAKQDMRIMLEYNTDIFEAESITRMLKHFQTLLESVVADPDQRLSDVPLLTDKEQHQLLVEWNDTQADYTQDKCIHQLFEEQVAKTPDAVAVVFEDQQLTYRQLNERSNQLAHYLRSIGAGPEALVGICLERSIEMIVGLLGILKTGGTYVPLDPTHPKDRLACILEDAQVSVLLTQLRLSEDLPEHEAYLICMDTIWKTITNKSKININNLVSVDNTAYVTYTSGSTGKPKGVQILHRAVNNFLNSMRKQPGLTDHDILLSVTTLSFDIVGLELFLPLTVGAVVVLVSDDVVVDGTRLLAQLTNSNTTVMQATPATWQLLIESGWSGSQYLRVLCGGEAFPRRLASQLIERVSDLWNMYGPTETTIWSAIYQVEVGDRPVPIGCPIVNTQIYLLDTHLNPVPIGVPGELHIGGVGLARGYLRLPDLTAEKFIPNPFNSETPGARLYKTGDTARYLPDGNIEFINRIDRQVKIRGFRIELGEIEMMLVQHPAVNQVVVTVRKYLSENKTLVAYIVSNHKLAPTTSELRRFLAEKLPDYMIPSAFIVLDVLPLTPNGKVDFCALPAPESTRPELDVAYTAPQAELERTIAHIWQEVLQRKKIGIYDNFFDLGGYSLLMVRVQYKLREVLSHELSLVEMFQYPTIHSITKYLSQEQVELPSSQLSQKRIDIRKTHKASVKQQRQRRRKSRLTKK
jgi:amino acid adenylation domain-containing protein